MVEPERAPRYHGCQMIMYLENSCGKFDNLSRIYCYKIPIESDKTTSIYNVSTRVLSKKIKHLLREENKVKENKIS